MRPQKNTLNMTNGGEAAYLSETAGLVKSENAKQVPKHRISGKFLRNKEHARVQNCYSCGFCCKKCSEDRGSPASPPASCAFL